VDGVIRALCGELPWDVALAAVGGYGRRELAPGSDIDLMFLHLPEGHPRVQQLVDAVLYPLWDSGLPVSHSVRTPEECRAEAASQVESLTALLDARSLAGSTELFGQARKAARDVAGEDTKAFVGALRRSRQERESRFGSVGRMLEPDLKEGLGGLRDIQALRWVAMLTGREDPAGARGEDPPYSLAGALDHLLLVRTALHRISASRSNRLVAEHHQQIADALGIEDRPGWEARDWLMRTVFGHGRWVEHAADVELESGHADRRRRAILPDDLTGTIAQPDGPDILRSEDALGTLDRLLPEWEGVRGRPQRDPYHRYPVDAHLLETLGEAARLVRKPEEPFVAEAATSIGDPAPLLLGALLHDIGKIGQGSHVQTGIDVAGRALERMRIGGRLRDDVLFLVGEHLLLSDTATRRNLEDEDLILHVAARVRDERRLALLYLLTVADAHATGPTASSPWRLGLVRELVAKVSHAFERGLMDRDRARRLARAESALREALASAGVPPDDALAFVEAMPPGYVLWAAPGDAADHLALVIPTPGPAEVRTSVRPGDAPGTYRLSLGAVDRLGLLAAVAGSMTLSGLSILSAQAFTTEGGLALDVFEVRGAFEDDVGADRWERFGSLIGEALQGRLDLRERVYSLRAHYRPTAGGTPVTVHIDQEASDFYTVVEVSSPDRLGLLFDLASTLSEEDLDVHVAKVATYGARVVDVFYVRDSAGQKLNDPGRAAELKRSLITAASEH
jgi:[protein-PII] uridylyltransferase